MALTRPNSTSFKPGQTGNPNGKPKVPEEIKVVRQIRDEALVNRLHEFGGATRPELKAITENKASTMFDLMIARVWLDAAIGNNNARTMIVERLWGKVADQVQVEAKQALKQEMETMATEDLVKFAKGDI